MYTLLDHFAARFESIHSRSVNLVEQCPAEKLFHRPKQLGYFPALYSCGEFIVRSAANVEMTFGGITRRLWDDPFEWTMAESIGSKEKVLEYFSEVRKTTEQGFAFIGSDENLLREIPAPVALRPIVDVLLESLCMAEHLQGRALALFQLLSDEPPPRL